MKLEDFVSETLKQIINGVRKAQEFAVKNGAKVNPIGLRFRPDQGVVKLIERGTNQIAQEIDFDVAVTTSEGTQTAGGIGIFIGPIGVGSRGQSDSKNSFINRIKFQVPVILPTQQIEDQL